MKVGLQLDSLFYVPKKDEVYGQSHLEYIVPQAIVGIKRSKRGRIQRIEIYHEDPHSQYLSC